MSLAVSIGCILAAAIAIYLTTKIQDEAFRAGMILVSLIPAFVTLVCGPWAIKLLIVLVPLFLGNSYDFKL